MEQNKILYSARAGQKSLGFATLIPTKISHSISNVKRVLFFIFGLIPIHSKVTLDKKIPFFIIYFTPSGDVVQVLLESR